MLLQRSFQFYHDLFGMVAVYRDKNFLQAQTPGGHDSLVLEEGTENLGKSGGIKHFGFRLADARDIDSAAATRHTFAGIASSQGLTPQTHWRCALVVLGFALTSGCEPSTPSANTVHAAAICDSVRTELTNLLSLQAAARWDSVAQLYSRDTSFRWIDSGKEYRLGAMLQGLAALRGVRAATRYDSTQIVALAPGLASITSQYRTEYLGASPEVRFEGAISMLWAHEPNGWRIRGGHSSSANPHAVQ